MVHATRLVHALAIGFVLTVPSLSEAGPPLICHPFQTDAAEVLPWGDGSHWNTPDRRYDVQRLTRDTLRLLLSNAPLLARMENLRRATIYAAQDARIADEFLSAVIARAKSSRRPDPHALFDAGYVIESYKQAAHLHRRAAIAMDGYALVQQAIALSGANPEMEFAASLMTSGATAEAHRRRAEVGAATGSLLARNLQNAK